MDRRTLIGAAIATLALVAAGCSGDGGSAPSPSPAASSAPVSPSASPTPSIAIDAPELPPITSVQDAGGDLIPATVDVDWTLVAFGRTWITGVEGGVGIFDATTGDLERSVRVEGVCAAMAAGFGAVWTATCGGEGGVARIDGRTARVTTVELTGAPEGESSVGAGEGAVWAVTSGPDCSHCVVARIDPDAMEVTDRFDVPPGAAAVRAGEGGVWLTYPFDDEVVRIDPATGEIVATIPVAPGPRFFDVGEGGVWVMSQADGALCQIDPTTDALVACTQIDVPGTDGGDLTVGDGWVWYRGTDQLVAQVDPATGEVVARFGQPEGSGSASAGAGWLWITAHDHAAIYRIPIDG